MPNFVTYWIKIDLKIGIKNKIVYKINTEEMFLLKNFTINPKILIFINFNRGICDMPYVPLAGYQHGQRRKIVFLEV